MVGRSLQMIWSLVISLWSLVVGQSLTTNNQRPTTPHVFALRGEALSQAKTLVREKDARVQPAYERLLHDADAALDAPLVAVTDKRTLLPPGGNKHDYYSLSPYWW